MSKDVLTKQEELTYLSSLLSKQIKTKFGKGPEACFTFNSDQYVVIHIKRFMTQVETELIKKNEIATARLLRSIIMVDLFASLKDTLQEMVEKEILQFYQDWNFHHNTGILIGVVGGEQVNSEKASPEVQSLKAEIVKQSEMLYDHPQKIEIERVSPETTVIKCSDFLSPMEMMLIDKGYVQHLQEREEIIRNRYMGFRSNYEKILSKKIEDIFMVWDYKNNVNYTVFSGR